MSKVRAFISIDIPEKIRKEIQKIQSKIPDFKGKLTEPVNLHLTLKFLGEIDEEILAEVRRRLKEIKLKSFETRISEIGTFSSKHIRIVWLKLENCKRLQKEIDKKLTRIFREEERFMSHLTIARVKSLKNRDFFLKGLKKIGTPELKFQVKKFNLKKSTLTSEGPVYEAIEEYDLE